MSDNWKTLGKKWSDLGLEVHLIDARNHGKSLHSNDFSYALMCADLKAYIAEHDIAQFDLLGHSMGGKTAMHFACENPENIKKLIVADIAPKAYPPHHDYIIDALKNLNFDLLKTRGEVDELLSKDIHNPGVRQFLMKNLYWKSQGILGLKCNIDALSAHRHVVGQPLSTQLSFSGPSLFLRGSRSDYISTEDFSAIKVHFPTAGVETIENAGHWLHAENPMAFSKAVLDFIFDKE
jgi:esterase